MYGHIRNSGISWVRSYADASKQFEESTPIRGRTEEPLRPLGWRNKVDNYSIRKEDDGTVACYLYSSPVVRFKPDGDIILRDYKYTTMSTSSFIEEVLGFQVSSRLFDHAICIEVGGIEVKLRKDTDLVLRKNEQGNLYAVNPPTATTHQLVRGMSNKVRKEFDAFTNYCKNMFKLRSDGTYLQLALTEYDATFTKPTPEEYSKTYKDYKDLPAFNTGAKDFVEDLEQLLIWMRDTNEHTQHLSFYKAMLALGKNYGRNTYGANWKLTGFAIPMQSLDYAIKEIAMGIHRDKVFIEVKTDSVTRDKYKNFFEDGWDRYHRNI
jgi:hypothetical protein